jgi:hypothetical protein
MSTISVQVLCQLICVVLSAGHFASAQDLGTDRAGTLHADVGGFVSKVLPMDSAGMGLRLDIPANPRDQMRINTARTGRRIAVAIACA